MRRLLSRLAMLGGFTIGLAGCSNGSGGAVPFAGPPNTAGGSSSTFQSGATSTALLRFVQGSPDFTSVDVCVDQLPFAITAPSTAYGAVSPLYAIGGGITHTVAMYPPITFGASGSECATAPGPYFGSSPIAVTTIGPEVAGSAARETIALGGTAASKTLGVYVFGEANFTVVPSGSEVFAHNAAPAYTAATTTKSLGFGYVAPSNGASQNVTGIQTVSGPAPSVANAAIVNGTAQFGINAIPTSFYAGAGAVTGAITPAATAAAPVGQAGQPYVVQLYAIDASGGRLGLAAIPEQIAGFGL